MSGKKSSSKEVLTKMQSNMKKIKTSFMNNILAILVFFASVLIIALAIQWLFFADNESTFNAISIPIIISAVGVFIAKLLDVSFTRKNHILQERMKVYKDMLNPFYEIGDDFGSEILYTLKKKMAKFNREVYLHCPEDTVRQWLEIQSLSCQDIESFIILFGGLIELMRIDVGHKDILPINTKIDDLESGFASLFLKINSVSNDDFQLCQFKKQLRKEEMSE